TLLALDQLQRASLDRYNVVVMPNGNYSALGKQGAEKLDNWVRRGGTLLARGGAMSWLSQNKIGNFSFKSESEPDSVIQRDDAVYSQARGSNVTGGAILNAGLDIAHPIGYGYAKPELATFRSGNQFLEPSANPYSNPMVYTDAPLASGYVHPTNLEQLRNS